MSETNTMQVSSSEKMNCFLAEKLLARIATSSFEKNQPHVVPVWYLWENGSIWISSYRSTRKIKDLQSNAKCSIVIDRSESFQGLSAVLFEGQAEIIDSPAETIQEIATRIYARYLGPDGVLEPEPQEWIHSPENLLIKLSPTYTSTW